MWNALTSSSNFVLESLETFAESTGVAGLIANMGWGSLIMICVAFFLLYLAIKHKFEPLLLLTIAFGMLLTNLPGANLYHTELFAGGHVHWDIFVAQAGLLDYLYLGVKLGIYPCLIFVGVGAMTDFGPLIANPKSFLLGAAAQLGIFLTFIGAYALGFSPAEAGSIGIIGGVIASLFGGWDTALQTLVIFMAIDYITGLVVAGVFHASPKTKTGALESKAGWKGLIRKGETLLIVLVACQLDAVIGGSFVRDAAIIGFSANEAISIVENAGLMGLPIPAAITKAIDILKQRAETPEKGKN